MECVHTDLCTTSSEATGLVLLGVGLYDFDCHADVPTRLPNMMVSHETPPVASARTLQVFAVLKLSFTATRSPA